MLARVLLLVALGAALVVGLGLWIDSSSLAPTAPSISTPSTRESPATPAIDAFYERIFRQYVEHDPEWASELRLFEADADPYGGQLTDVSRAAEDHRIAFLKDKLTELRGFDRAAQSPSQLLATDVLDWYMKDAIRGHGFWLQDYPVDHLFAYPAHLISTMTDIHSVRNLAEAEAYVARLSQFDDTLETLVEGLERREAAGVVPARVIVQKTLGQMRSFVGGSPQFNTLYTTLERQLDDLDGLSAAERQSVLAAARDEIRNSVYPGYRALIAYLERLEPTARGEDEVGVWSLPHGDAYYAHLVRHHTTTNLSPEAIHDIGHQEVRRIQSEMQTTVFDAVGISPEGAFGNRIRRFWGMTRSDPELRYPNSPQGRNQALTDYQRLIAEARQASQAMFNTVPEARVRVAPVPRYMQNTSPGAFYMPPSLDGERAGTFFVNLGNLPFRPAMPTLAYHEAVPGHHFQLALQRESAELPTFQRALVFTAHAEGWALYSEKLMREQGVYDSPASRFENLWSELFRAARLVVDTGIHAERWSRNRAIQYMQHTLGTGMIGEIDRYIAMPGQALSYKIGELTILDLRERARDALGEAFRLKDFHDVVIGDGSLPMSLLEREVERYIDGTLAAEPRGALTVR